MAEGISKLIEKLRSAKASGDDFAHRCFLVQQELEKADGGMGDADLHGCVRDIAAKLRNATDQLDTVRRRVIKKAGDVAFESLRRSGLPSHDLLFSLLERRRFAEPARGPSGERGMQMPGGVAPGRGCSAPRCPATVMLHSPMRSSPTRAARAAAAACFNWPGNLNSDYGGPPPTSLQLTLPRPVVPEDAAIVASGAQTPGARGRWAPRWPCA